MSISLYDISIASSIQSVTAVAGILETGKTYCKENNIDLDDIVEMKFAPDMLPFRFQIISVHHHSLGSIRGVESGKFAPPTGFPDYDYEGLQGLIAETLDGLKAYTPEAVNAMEGNEVVFGYGDISMPFTASNFVLSFSHPNLYFHATTAYDMLRMKGAPLGKRDYMGVPRMLAK